MKVVWIIDNKFRELYGLYNLKKILLKNNIKLYLFHIPVWKTAIDFINPQIIVVPNLARSSCAPIVNYASRKKIKIFMHSSEGMYYSDNVQKDKYPIALIKKIEKVCIWGKLDAFFLKKKGFKKKIVETGCLKFDKRNYDKVKHIKSRNKIKVVGIPTPLRVITGYNTSKSKKNIPLLIRQRIEANQPEKLGFLKFEIEYIEILVKILKNIDKNIKIIFKTHPFESKEIYKKTFPEHRVYEGEDIREFLGKVDLILNIHSSVSVDAIKYKIPVISLNNLIKWDKKILENKNRGPNAKHGSVKLGIMPKNISELDKLLKFTKKKLFDICKKKNLLRQSEELAITHDSLGKFTELFLKYKTLEKTGFRYLYFIKYILFEIRQIYFRRKNYYIFKRWSFNDRSLLKKLRIR